MNRIKLLENALREERKRWIQNGEVGHATESTHGATLVAGLDLDTRWRAMHAREKTTSSNAEQHPDYVDSISDTAVGNHQVDDEFGGDDGEDLDEDAMDRAMAEMGLDVVGLNDSAVHTSPSPPPDFHFNGGKGSGDCQVPTRPRSALSSRPMKEVELPTGMLQPKPQLKKSRSPRARDRGLEASAAGFGSTGSPPVPPDKNKKRGNEHSEQGGDGDGELTGTSSLLVPFQFRTGSGPSGIGVGAEAGLQFNLRESLRSHLDAVR